MERNHEHNAAPEDDNALLLQALDASREGSVVDALMALPAEAGDDGALWERAVNGGIQAALARKMRALIAQEKDSRNAA